MVCLYAFGGRQQQRPEIEGCGDRGSPGKAGAVCTSVECEVDEGSFSHNSGCNAALTSTLMDRPGGLVCARVHFRNVHARLCADMPFIIHASQRTSTSFLPGPNAM